MAMMATPKCESYYSPVEDEKAKLQAQLNNCASWYDGCNTCMVKDGKIRGCTRMACRTKKEPYCKKEVEKPNPKLKDCATWYDGCNDCVVKDGNILGCTKMYCEKKSKPYCKEKIEVKPDINLKNCA
jgi:hypothetical protein